jgi:hypothetical protein
MGFLYQEQIFSKRPLAASFVYYYFFHQMLALSAAPSHSTPTQKENKMQQKTMFHKGSLPILAKISTTLWRGSIFS